MKSWVRWSALVSVIAFASPAQSFATDLLVKLKPRASGASFDAMSASFGAASSAPLTLMPRLRSIELPEGVSVEAALELYRASGLVEYAEPNFEVRAIDSRPDPVAPGASANEPANPANPASPKTDELFATQWGLSNTGQDEGVAGVDIGAIQAWELASASTGSRQVVVAVIDTGVEYTHPDLAANMWLNEGEIPGDKVDNDGNGFVDDVFGWDFANKDNDPKDDHFHGTHCAGVIGAAHDGKGVMGVSAQVRIMAVKFLRGNGGGTMEAALKATEYAILNKADILSNSWGGDRYSQAFADLIEEANRRGILYIAAAGNDHGNNDTQPTYPASYKNANVITVAAIDNQDKPAKFTNWGRTSVHLAAPGVKIMSTVLDGKHKAYSGTSMACPHVAGAAALLKSHTGLSHLELKKRLLETVQQTPKLDGLVSTAGRLNVYQALAGIVSEPLPPETGWTEVAHSLSSPHNYPAMADL
jgi:subtilisin family serine protease